MIVWFVGMVKRREISGHVNAPIMPEEMDVMERRAMWTVSIFSSVRAKRMAVPDTVAMASERRNQATRKRRTWRSLRADFIVARRERQEKRMEARKVRSLPFWLERVSGRGGPGRFRSQREDGMMNMNHQRPTMKRTSRRGSVDEALVLDMR